MRLRDDCLKGVCAAIISIRLPAILALIAFGMGTWAIAAPAPAGPTAVAPPAPGTAAQPATPRTTPPTVRDAQRPLVPSTAPAGPPPKFRCDELTYNFPEVWTGDFVEHTWVIHNDGQGVLDILRVQTTCGCTVPQDYSKQIQPGGEGKITIRLNTRGLHTETTKNIIVHTNDPAAAQVTLQLKGKVRARLSLDPPAGAQFGTVTVATPFPLTKTVRVTNNTDKTLKLEPSPALTNLPYTVSVQEVTPGKVYDVTVNVDKDKLKEGNNYAAIMLRTGFPEEPEFALPANLVYPPIIQVSTSSLAVATPVAATFHRELTATYTGGGPMKITSVSANDPDIKVSAREAPVAAPPPVGAASPAPAQPPQVPGQAWIITVDIPMGWDPPPPPPPAGAAPPQQTTYEITAKTDVPAKPELKIRLFTYPQKPNVNAVALIGTLAPQAAITDNTGKAMQLGGATGHVTVTAFFTSWCPHCKRMLPILQKVAAIYAKNGVDFNLISLDQTAPAADVAKVMENLGVTMPYALDARQVVGAKYGANKFPMTYLVGKDGIIEAVNQGCPANYEQTLRDQLDILLAGKNRKDFPVVASATRPAPTTPLSATRPATPVQDNPLLIVDNLNQDMGAFKPGTTGKFNLHLRNGGGQPLNLTNLTPSAGLIVDPASPKVLQPNVPAALSVQFDVPKQPGAFRHELTIESNDPAKPKVTVTLNGTVRKLIEVDPATVVDFGRRPVTFEMPRMATLTWNGEGTVNFLGVESSNPKFEATLRPIQQGPNHMVLIKAKPPFEVGEVTANITIQTDCKEQPTIIVPVKLVQPERIEVVPSTASVTKTARLQEATVAITNNGGNSLHILGVTVSNPAKMRTQFYPEVDGLSYKLKVTLLPGYSPPPQGDKVTIRTDDAQFAEIVVPVKVTDAPSAPTAGISQLPQTP